MNNLPVNGSDEMPDADQISQIWKTIRFEPCDEWSAEANKLEETINYTHCNGGVQLHKYKVIGNDDFKWFVQQDKLHQIKFLKNVIKHPDLKNYRENLEITEDKPRISCYNSWSDIYDLPGTLSRIMGQGGAYNSIDQHTAWQTTLNFIEGEFQNRFQEITLDYINVIPRAEWFYDVTWDFSMILFDRTNCELMFIDITDTD